MKTHESTNEFTKHINIRWFSASLMVPNFIIITGVSAAGKDSVLRGLYPLFLNEEIGKYLSRAVALEDHLDGLITQDELNQFPVLESVESGLSPDMQIRRSQIKKSRQQLMNQAYDLLPIWPARSHATRDKRPGEIEDVYKFITKEQFLENMKNKEYFETAKVYGKYKGTPISEILNVLSMDKIPIKLIDPEGTVKAYQRKYDGILPYIISIDVPEEVMIKRITNRNMDNDADLRKKIDAYWQEKDIIGNISGVDVVENIENINNARQKICDLILDNVFIPLSKNTLY